MKKSLFYNTVLILSILFISSSCTSSDDGETLNNLEEIATIKNTTAVGTWIVTNFNDSGQDKTSNLDGYQFTFETNGVLTASNTTNTYTGSWSVTSDNSSSPSNNSSNSHDDEIEFNILFSSPSVFQELSDDWHIISHSSTMIKLTDISGGNGGTDFLTFEKS